MEKESISSHDFTKMGYSYSLTIEKYIEDKMMPKIEEIYKKLKKHHKYNPKLDRMKNISEMFYAGDADYYAGIIEPKVFKHNSRAIYIHMDSLKFVLHFIDKPYINSFKDSVNKGIRAVQVFEPLNIECIEKSWGVKTTEQWATKLSLTAETFTDETKYSQKIGKHIHCERPTLERYINDHNTKTAFDYPTIISTCSRIDGGNCEIQKVTAAMFSLYAIGIDLKVEGMKI